MAIAKRKKKNPFLGGRRTGINAAPIEKGFEAVRYFFQTEATKNDAIGQIKTYLKNTGRSKNDQKLILANPDATIVSRCTYWGAAAAFWSNIGESQTEDSKYWIGALDKRLDKLVETGKSIHNEKLETVATTKVVSLSPHQRLQQKIGQTIMQDLDDLEDAWIKDEKASIDVYSLFRKHGLSGSATMPVRKVVEGWLLDYEDAYHKRCEQAVEGYSHLKRSELNRRIKECKAMLADLDRIKDAAKATRKIRIKKAPSIDKQVARVKYKKEDAEYKIASIPPVQVIGKHRLFVFNCKYRQLIEYVTDDPKGFIISGTTIKNISKEKSRSVKLRKPMDVLPLVTKKTIKQVGKIIDELKTKPQIPNGRLNEETILLKVDK
jgi:hypothetical protein